MFKKTAFYSALIAMTASVSPASADTFVYHDPEYDFTVSYPDSWDSQNATASSVRWKVSPPGSTADHASCSIKADHDGTLTLYPEYRMDQAVAHRMNDEFWANELGQFHNVGEAKFYTPAGFGQGYATSAHVSYTDGEGDDAKNMYAVLLGSVYADTRYVMKCQSTAQSFGKWRGIFGGIMDSVTLKQKYHPVPTGYYRDFLSDPKKYNYFGRP